MARLALLDSERRWIFVVVLALYVVSMQVDSGSSRATNQLLEDEALYVGGTRTSLNGLFRLAMQADCNLVLYYNQDNFGKRALWSSGTEMYVKEARDCYFILQTDGDAVLFNNTGGKYARIFSTGTAPNRTNGASRIEVQKSGSVVMYNGGGSVIWSLGQ